jgi:hypothetical protein
MAGSSVFGLEPGERCLQSGFQRFDAFFEGREPFVS